MPAIPIVIACGVVRSSFVLRKRTRLVLKIVILGGLIALGYYFVDTKYWQRWDFDAEWCRDIAVQAKPIVDALAVYHLVHNRYPDNLSALEPDYLRSMPFPTNHPSGSGGRMWLYRLVDDDEYELSVPCIHWVSSFDAIVYRPSERYPEQWRRTTHCFDVDGWLYVVGKSQLDKRRVSQVDCSSGSD